MKDLYSFDTDFEGLDVSYQKMFDAYNRIFDRCGVPDGPRPGRLRRDGRQDTHEFVYLTEHGEDSCLLCPSCGYAANAEVAAFVKEPAHAGRAAGARRGDRHARPVHDRRPGRLPGHPARRRPARPSSTSPRDGGSRPVFVAIRGDMDVNETKLRHALGAIELHYMDEEEVRRRRLRRPAPPAPSASTGVRIVADDLVPQRAQPGGRRQQAGHAPPEHQLRPRLEGRRRRRHRPGPGGLPLRRTAGTPDGRCAAASRWARSSSWAPATPRSWAPPSSTPRASSSPAVMGSLRHRHRAPAGRRDRGEPRRARDHLAGGARAVPGAPRGPAAGQAGRARAPPSELYDELQAGGLEVLYDDRDETPGVKFNDADLLGMPLRVTVSPRNLEKGSLELKRAARRPRAS